MKNVLFAHPQLNYTVYFGDSLFFRAIITCEKFKILSNPTILLLV